MAIEPSSRVQIVEYPSSFPSKCALCGASPNTGDPRKWIDFGADLEEYGSIYFCTFCIAEVAGIIGYVGPAVHMSICDDLAQTQLANEILTAENEEFRRVFSTLRGLGIDVPDSVSSSDDELPDSEDSIPEPSDTSIGHEPTEPEVDKPVRGKRSRIVPSSERDSDGDGTDGLSF